MQLIVRFRLELDVTYSNGVFHSSFAEAIESINNILRSFPDAHIEPLFSGDPSSIPTPMRDYYTVILADADRAQDLQYQLQHQRSVEAAYIKPPDELP